MAKNRKGARGARSAYPYLASTQHGRRNTSPPITSNLISKMSRHFPNHASFTMQDEQKNTAYNHSLWDRGARLRDQPLAFVSGGQIEPLKEDIASPEPANETRVAVDQTHQEPTQTLSERHIHRAENGQGQIVPPHLPSDSKSTSLLGTTGDSGCLSKSSPTTLCVSDNRSSDEESDSSKEVILFKGRGLRKTRADTAADLSPREKDGEIRAVDPTTESAFGAFGALGVVSTFPTSTGRSDQEDCDGVRGGDEGDSAPEDDEDSLIADYIANMLDNGLHDIAHKNGLHSRDLGGVEGDVVLAERTHSETGSATKTEAGFSLQKPVDNEPNPHSVHEDAETSRFQEDDAHELSSEVDDEQLARLLSKQEELGLGGDELLLFDGGFRSTHKQVSLRSKKKLSESTFIQETRKLAGQYPSASTVADAFEEFDLMDWDRPSLQNNPNKSRGGPSFNLSDSELEANLNMAWQKDRLKKRGKKQAREDLRAQGLLGKNVNPEDPRTKYQTGIKLDEIKDELKSFLLGSEESLSLPPMDANARKIIHEFANRLKLKSKSQGAGDQRRPVLYRTKNTAAGAVDGFDTIFARIGRRYFSRLDNKATGENRQVRGGGGVNYAAVTVRDGEIVGGSAPEIAVTNRGRAMLEKMGWSHGMALGTLDSKGITQPIEHIVKRSKAGLG